MIITITGTPGTGKTSVAEHLKNDFTIIDLTEFAKENDLGEEKGEFEVDVRKMVETLESKIDRSDDFIIEGHLSHHFPADYCVVLRTEPRKLRERLSERDYPEEKVEENVESEALDLILQEAAEEQENIIEMDTTGRDAGNVAEEIERRIEEDETGYGQIDWSDYL